MKWIFIYASEKYIYQRILVLSVWKIPITKYNHWIISSYIRKTCDEMIIEYFDHRYESNFMQLKSSTSTKNTEKLIVLNNASLIAWIIF